MTPKHVGLGLIVGLSIGFFGLSVAAANQSTAHCDDMLVSLDPIQTSLNQMERAIEANTSAQWQLSTEATTLAETIEQKRSHGVSASDIQPLLDRHVSLLQDLAEHQKLRPALDSQLDVLVTEVDRAQKQYIACIEETL